MKCKCGNELGIELRANIACKGCKLLTAMTTILTIQCEKCGAVFQIPVSSKSVLNVKKEE